jgi:ABC transport system ATP-binding/permease protein
VDVLLSARALKKSFGSRQLFDELSFSVNAGDRIGLIGPNGAGKSTLLSLLAGETEADGGEVVKKRGLRTAFLRQTPTFEQDHSVLDAILEGAAAEADPIPWALEVYSKVGLDSLGKTPDTKVRELSGGWQKRTALARELAKRPDVLLLDEPTNHLDIEAILWLETFLARAPFAVVTITHDRYFLQNVSNRILELDRRNFGGLLSVDGDYSKYLERKESILAVQQSREESLRNRLRRETEWLRRGAKARTTKQQARIQRAGDLKDEVQDLAEKNASGTVRMSFGGTERKTKRLIEAKQIKKCRGPRTLFEKLDLFLGPGTRLGLLGPNGCGKSTLIRVLLGQEPADGGTVVRADNLSVAYFEQNRESLDPQTSLLKTICPSGDHVKFQGRFLHVRSYLDRFLFAKEQSDLPVGRLSGGEQARLLIARLMLTESDVLVLDEPTNDLDISTLDVLQTCLEEFPGSVILVSHDRYFLDQVSNELLAFTPKAGEVQKFADLAQWETWRDALAPPEKVSASPTPAATEPAKKKQKLGYKEARELETMESRIHETEAKLAALSAEAENPANATNAGRLSELYQQITATQAEIERLFERWQELESKGS